VNKKKTLHILKNKKDQTALDFIKQIEGAQKIAIILIHNAVSMDLSALKTQPLVLAEDLCVSTNTSHQKISYEKMMLAMIFEYDAVVSW